MIFQYMMYEILSILIIITPALTMCEYSWRDTESNLFLAWPKSEIEAGILNDKGELYIMTMTNDERLSTRARQPFKFDLNGITTIESSAGDNKRAFLCDSSNSCIIASLQNDIVSRGPNSLFKYSNNKVNAIKAAVMIDTQHYGLQFDNYVVVVNIVEGKLTGFEKGAPLIHNNIYSSESIHGVCSQKGFQGDLYYVKNWTLCHHMPRLPNSENCYNLLTVINPKSQLQGFPHQPLGCDVSSKSGQAIIGSYYGLFVVDFKTSNIMLIDEILNVGYPKFFTYEVDSIEYITFITDGGYLARATYNYIAKKIVVHNRIRFHSRIIDQDYYISRIQSSADKDLYFGKIGNGGVFTFKMSDDPGELNLFHGDIDHYSLRQITKSLVEYQYLGKSLGMVVSRIDGRIESTIKYLGQPLDFSPINGYDYTYLEKGVFKVWSKSSNLSEALGRNDASCYGGGKLKSNAVFTEQEGVFIAVTGSKAGWNLGQTINKITKGRGCVTYFRDDTSYSKEILLSIRVGYFGGKSHLFMFFEYRIVAITELSRGDWTYALERESRINLIQRDNEKLDRVSLITDTSIIINSNFFRTDFFRFYDHNYSIIRTTTLIGHKTEAIYLSDEKQYWLVGEDLMIFNQELRDSAALNYKFTTIIGPKIAFPFIGNSSIVLLSPSHYTIILFHETWLCIKCHKDCDTCYGELETNCLTCTSDFIFDPLLFKCKRICQEYNFPNEQNICVPCSEHCTHCIGNTANECTSCSTGYELDLKNACSKECSSYKQFRNLENGCQDCHVSCYECQGPEINDCSRCIEGEVLVDNRCLKPCPSDNYREPAPSYECRKCNNYCLTCSGPEITDCMTCHLNSTFVSEKSYCQPNCKQGFYPILDECKPCHSTCKNCNGESAIRCLECFENYIHRPIGDCSCDILNGYYLQGSSCIKCHSACKRCSGTGLYDCIECSADKFTYEPVRDKMKENFKCRGDCPTNTFTDLIDRRCIECHETCKECYGSSEINCKNCKTGKLYLPGNHSCVDECPMNYYAIAEDKISCGACPRNCLRCLNYQPSICQDCIEGTFMYKYNCYEICPIGTRPAVSKFSERNICVDCLRYCEVCKEDSVCQKCKENYLLVEGKCMSFCPVGFKLDKGENICKKTKCIANCDICSSSTTCSRCLKESNNGKIVLAIQNKCIECVEINGLVQVDNTCQEICGDGFFYKLSDSKSQCDDGNLKPGDGCSSECEIERGFTCSREFNFKAENIDVRDLCQQKTIGRLELNTTVQAKVIINLYFSLGVEINPLRIESYYNLNYTSKNSNTTLLLYEAEKISRTKYTLTIKNEILIDSTEDYIGRISLTVNRELKDEELIKDINGFVVDMSQLSTDFNISIEKLRSEIKMKGIENWTKRFMSSIIVQVVIAILILNPLIYDIAVNLLQKLIYYRVLWIETPVILNNFLALVSSTLDFNPVKTDLNEANKLKVSIIDEALGISLLDLETISEFQKIGMTQLYIKSGFIFLIIGGCIYVVAMAVETIYSRMTTLFIHKKTGAIKSVWRRNQRIYQEVLEFLADNLIWKRVILWILGIFPKLTISIFLNLRGARMAKPITFISFCLANISLILIAIMTIILINISNWYLNQTEQKKESRNDLNFLAAFRSDNQFAKQYLTFRFILRPVFMSLTSVFLFEYPIMVILSYVLIHLLELVCLILNRPSKYLSLNIKWILEATVFLLISLIYLLFWIVSSPEVLNFLGWGAVSLVCILMIGSIGWKFILVADAKGL